MNRTAALAVLFLGIAYPELASGICIPKEVLKSDPYQYTITLVDSLGYASSGRSRVTTDPATVPPGARLDAVKKMMVELKSAIQDYECAASLVKPYIDSEDEAIQISARGAHTAYKMLAMSDAKIVNDLRVLLDGQMPQPGVGSRLEAIANDEVQIDEAWKLLPVAAVAATHGIVHVESNDNEPLTHFRISDVQRQSILKTLKDLFPRVELERGMQAGQLPLETAASALYAFVADRRWKSAGE